MPVLYDDALPDPYSVSTPSPAQDSQNPESPSSPPRAGGHLRLVRLEDAEEGVHPFLREALQESLAVAEMCGHVMGPLAALGVGLWIASFCQHNRCNAYVAAGARDNDFIVRLRDFATPESGHPEAEDCPFRSGDSYADLVQWTRDADFDQPTAILIRNAVNDATRDAANYPYIPLSALIASYIQRYLDAAEDAEEPEEEEESSDSWGTTEDLEDGPLLDEL